MAINSKYFRSRRYDRIRHGRKLTSFLAGLATALATTATGQTVAPVRTTNTKAEALITISGGSVAAADYVEINGRRYTFKTALTEVHASKTLTNDGTDVTAADTVTIGGQVYTFKSALTEALASDVFTVGGGGSVIANGNTVTLNGKVYTFETSLTNVDGHVLIGANDTAALVNLKNAINLGTNGGTYAAATTVHPTITATASNATTLTVKAKTVGTAGNALTAIETSNGSWATATLAGGVDAIANEVLRGVSNTATMTALYEAINAGANAGAHYSTGTVANASVSATNPSGTTVTVTALLPGTAGNAIAISEASSHLSWAAGATVLSGGVAAVADEVLVGNGTTESRDNLIVAITAGAGVGTAYSTGTTANAFVTASASSANVLLTALSAANILPGMGISLVKSGAHLSVPATLDGPAWTATAHGFSEGEGPYLLTTATTRPAGSPAAGTEIYVHVINANTIALACGREALRRGDFVQTTDAGTGTHTLTRSETAQGVFNTLKRVKPRTAFAATDIDSL